jgi:hypothetical protein
MERSMSKQFKVGDVCVGRGFVVNTDRNGLECVILQGLAVRHAHNLELGIKSEFPGYLVEWSDGQVAHVRPETLHRKRPPRRDIDEVVSWESVGWMPMDVKLDRAIKESLRGRVRERA